MKKIIFSSLAVVLMLNLSAQRKCGATEHEQFLLQKNPNRAQERADYEKAIQKYIANNENKKTTNPQTGQVIVTIPLVVHMVWNSASDSVSDAQIFSQINILNQDFTRTNPDAANTPAPFAAVASSPQINYCWAQRDPAGNPTTGIERRKSTTVTWSTDDKVKFFSTGGLDAWDPSRYFNIWVCRLSSGLLGYGEFPSGTLSNTYGFVAQFNAFGNTGFAQAPFNGGRTGTHEVGHCLNLYHIWGDDGTACSGSDACADTPNQAGENYGCPTYPLLDGCSGTAPGVMFMNYMDYTDDACMNTFTANQSTRMLAVVNNPPYNSLTTSTGCLPLTLPPIDAGITTITKPVGTVCATTFTPNVTIKNWGANTLTSATINYKVDNGTVQTTPWSGSLASLATATVALPSVTTTAGTHSFTAYTSAPNSGTDGNAANDQALSNFTIVASALALPYSEGFESTTFPTNGMTLNNPDAGITWARTTAAKKSGVASAFLDNANYASNGQIDDIVLPNLDLTGGTNHQITFEVAYQLYTAPTANPNYSDTLSVLLSTDCGATWNQIYKKFLTALTTTTPAFSTTTFTPTANQWRQETVSLTTYASFNNVIIKFRNVTDYENQLYIDDVNITSTIGIKTEAPLMGIFIYPNPSADGKFMVDIKKNQNDVNKLSVYDVLGNKVYEINQKIPVGSYDMDLSNLSNGTYFVEVIKDSKLVFTKIVINK